MAKTRIGINHPWTQFGWDFGVPPTDWNANPASTTRPWKQDVDKFLDDYQRSGIKVVRWHLLCDCLTYGTATWAAGDKWSCDAPRISAEFEADFKELLVLLKNKYKGMQLIPVVIDVSAFWAGRGVVNFKKSVKDKLRKASSAGEKLQREIRRRSDESPSRWVVRLRDEEAKRKEQDKLVESAATPGVHKGGRGDLLVKHRRTFLDNVLQPLLALASDFREQIFAWEVMNEPEYALAKLIYKDNDPDVLLWEPAGFETWNKPYDAGDVRGFIGECAKRIAENKFPWTVGFQHFKSLTDWEVLAATGNSTQATALYRPQFHYYGDPKVFPNASSASPRPFIGEFALQDPKPTADPSKNDDGPWEVTAKGSATPVPKTALQDRLCAIEDAGYELALGWSARAHGTETTDKRSAWTPSIMAAIKNANDGKACQDQPAAAPTRQLPRVPIRVPFKPPR